MADFSIQATQLAAPQGAGSSPVAPVQEMVVPDNTPQLVGNVANAFASWVKSARTKDDNQGALDTRSALAKELYTISQGYAKGTFSASEAATRARVAKTRYLGSNPAYTEDIDKVYNSFTKGGILENAEDAVSQQKKYNERIRNAAIDEGVIPYSGMNPANEAVVLDAFQTSREIEARLKRQREANAEDRAARSDVRSTESHNASMDAIARKKQVENDLILLGDKNFSSFSSIVNDALDQVKSGRMTYEEVAPKLLENYQRIRQGIVALSVTDPETGRAFVSLIDDMHRNAVELLDPSKASERNANVAQNRWNETMARAKLTLWNDNPRIRVPVASSAMFGHNAALNMKLTTEISNFISSAAFDPNNTPYVLDAPYANDAVTATKTIIASAIAPDNPKGAQATDEVARVTNTWMEQVASPRGAVTASMLKESVKLFSSNEFGELVKAGKVNNQTMQAAKMTLQAHYVPEVRVALRDRLDQDIAVTSGMGVRSTKKAREFLDISFNNNAVVFTPRRGSEAMSLTNQSSLREIQTMSNSITQIVKMGAHLEGTTDYQEYWERNKALIVPGFFHPESIKVGEVRNGYKYLGGDATSQSSWEPVNGGTN